MPKKIAGRLGILNSPGYRPFINAFKQAWSWQGDRNNMGWDALVAAGHMTPGGQLLSVAPNSGGFRTRVLERLPVQTGASGKYRLTWKGRAVWELFGARNIDTSRPNEIRFDYTANGGSHVDTVVRSIDPSGGPVEDILLAHESDWADADAGRIFRRQFLEETRPFKWLQFDEWVGILTSEAQGGLRITSWESRALPTDEIFHRFVPYEWMAALCRELDSAMILCLPTAVTDDHMRNAAALIRTLLPAPRKVWVGLSTKQWDFSGSPQARYFDTLGRNTFGTSTQREYLNGYALRVTRMAQIWREVWGDDARLTTMIQTQTDNEGVVVDILNAPLWRTAAAAGRAGVPPYVPPHSVIDMLTVHAVIDGNMAYGAAASQLETWRVSLPRDEAFNRIRDRMLSGAGRTVASLTPKWNHFRRAADERGMSLGSYEVANHLNGIGGSAILHAFMHDFSVSRQMGEVYTATFNALEDADFDGPLSMSVDCRTPDQNTMHGLQRWHGDHNEAWQAVMGLIEDAPVVVMPPVVTPPVVEPPVVVPPVVTPPVIVPEPEPEPEPTPTPTPDPVPEQIPEDADMDRKLLTEMLELLKAGVALLDAHLSAEPATPAPIMPPVEPPVQPPVTPPVTPAPPVTPPVTSVPTGYRAVQDFRIDRDTSYNWGNTSLNIFLPNWAGGDRQNGVGGSWGTPSRVAYGPDKEVTLTAGMVGGQWRNSAIQLNRPVASIGKWGAVVTCHTDSAVNAVFTHDDNGKELDFELVKRGGVIGWAPAVHMPRSGGGRAHGNRRPMKLGEFKRGVPQRLEVELFTDRCEFSIDGVVFETVRPADMSDGFIWDTTTPMALLATIERHAKWAGWASADYAQESRMTVHAFTIPVMP